MKNNSIIKLFMFVLRDFVFESKKYYMQNHPRFTFDKFNAKALYKKNPMVLNDK